MNKIKAFTLIIMGILAAIVIPPYIKKFTEDQKIIVTHAHGKMDGFEYDYEREPGNHRRLVLKDPNDPGPNGFNFRFWTNDNNVIGNSKNDEYTIMKGDSGITYTNGWIGVLNKWEGEILPRDKALEQATVMFREWEAKIEEKHGYKIRE